MRLALFALVLSACAADPTSDDRTPPRAGGATTTDDRSSSAFESPAANLDAEALERHFEGDVAFGATFVSPPADVNPGLGPLFNNSSCGACHVRNGRGLPVAGTSALGSMALVRVSLGTDPVPELGMQVQDHGTFQQIPEANVVVSWTEEASTYPSDGEPYSLRRPAVSITLADGTALGADVMTSLRIAAPVFGLGLLEALSDEALLAREDPNDADGDGISGRVNRVWDLHDQTSAIGRFGWKASSPSLVQQAAVAYFEDIGVSNLLLPGPGGEIDIDIDEAKLEITAFYTQTLGVPARRNPEDPEVLRGEHLFAAAGCASCHAPVSYTGEHAIAALRDQRIFAYTDLLLHNMGFDLADSRPDSAASGTEWRTPPLWGIGLTERVLGDAVYLHDGRARSLAEAILWHGGEAQASRDRFRTMHGAERSALTTFLESL